MGPQTYRVTLSDGREFDVTTEGGPPSEQDILGSLSADATRKPAAAEDFMDPPEDKGSMVGRVLSGAGNAIVEGVKGTAALVGMRGPIEQFKSARGMIDAQIDQYRKAKAAQAEGRTSEMVGHSVAAALPMVGPMAARWGEMIGNGEAPEAAGEMIVGALTPAAVKGGKTAAGVVSKRMATRAATRAAEALTAAESDLALALPKADRALFSTAKPYLNEQAKAAPITTVAELIDASDAAITGIEGRASQIVQAFPEARLRIDYQGVVQKALGDTPRGKALDVAMRELEDLPLDRDLTLPELDRIRLQMNAENKAIRKRNNYDQATARKVDPGYAAREALAAEIRDRLYGYLEQRGVEGVRQMRMDEGALIQVRDAALKELPRSARGVAGGAQAGLLRRMAAKGAEKAGTFVGAKAAGGPGALVGAEAGGMVGDLIRGTAPSRDVLVGRAFKVADDRLPTYPTVPERAPVAGELGPGAIEMSAGPDGSYVRSERGEYAVPERKALPAGRPSVETPPPADTSGRIEPTLPENYGKASRDIFGAEESKPVTPQAERVFLARWLADDLREMNYQPGSLMSRKQAQQEWMTATTAEDYNRAVYSPRSAGTPLQEMFHAAGIKGSRADIANKLDRYMQTGKGDPRIGALVDVMREAWDGQRFDFAEVSDQTLSRAGIRRRELRSPITTPWPDDMPEVHERFFPKTVPDDDFNFEE